MGSLNVRPVQSRRDLTAFIKLPFRLHRGTPWVPPLIMERRDFLDRDKNPFFNHAEAEYFLAERDAEEQQRGEHEERQERRRRLLPGPPVGAERGHQDERRESEQADHPGAAEEVVLSPDTDQAGHLSSHSAASG